MKKRKFNILLNIAVLCMCVCAIAIGVYSAKTASLNVSGTIGFTAHNINIGLSGSVVACVNSEATERTTKTFSETNIGGTQTNFSLNLNNKFSGSDTGKLYFSDLFDDGKIIVITLTFTNNSDFAVKATANMPTIVGAGYSQEVKLGDNVITNTTSSTIAKNGTLTLTITLTLTNEDTNIDSATISGELMTFKKVVIKTAILTYVSNSCEIKFEEGMTWKEWAESNYWKQTEDINKVTYSPSSDPGVVSSSVYVTFKSINSGGTLYTGGGNDGFDADAPLIVANQSYEVQI